MHNLSEAQTVSISVYKERREKLVAFLRTLQPQQFNIGEIINDCGTTCCIAGWMHKVFPDVCQIVHLNKQIHIAFNDFGTHFGSCTAALQNASNYLGLKWVSGNRQWTDNNQSPLMPGCYTHEDSGEPYIPTIEQACEALMEAPYVDNH